MSKSIFKLFSVNTHVITNIMRQRAIGEEEKLRLDWIEPGRRRRRRHVG